MSRIRSTSYSSPFDTSTSGGGEFGIPESEKDGRVWGERRGRHCEFWIQGDALTGRWLGWFARWYGRGRAFCSLASCRDGWWPCGDVAKGGAANRWRLVWSLYYSPTTQSSRERSRRIDGNRRNGNVETRVETIVCKKWGNLSWGMDIIVVGKFRHGNEVHPIILLVVGCKPEVLFKDLVDLFGLTISLRVVPCWQVHRSPECL